MIIFLDRLEGPTILKSDTRLVAGGRGDVTVASGCRVELDGELAGNLLVCAGATAVINGSVRGVVRSEGGTVLGDGSFGALQHTDRGRFI